MRIPASCFVVMLFCLLLTPPASAQTELPSNLRVADIYREFVESIADSSPTFEGQLSRVGAATSLTVHLAVVPDIIGARATTRFERRGREIIAWIEVERFDDVIELIAHEMEHVIERIEGVNFAAAAGVANSGIHLVSKSGTVFETDRATRAGRSVAAEVHEWARRPI